MFWLSVSEEKQLDDAVLQGLIYARAFFEPQSLSDIKYSLKAKSAQKSDANPYEVIQRTKEKLKNVSFKEASLKEIKA